MTSQAPRLIALFGATASGKTSLAEKLAEELDALLVSADAFQVYRGFTIGTAKPAASEKYALIDILEPTESFGLGLWLQLAQPLLQEAFSQGRNVIVVGGTGLLLRGLMEEYQEIFSPPDPPLRASLVMRLQVEGLGPLAAELVARDPQTKVALDNPVRVTRALERLESPKSQFEFSLPPFRKQKFALWPPIEVLDHSISMRLHGMMQDGFVEEVRRLTVKGVPKEAPAFRAIGYRTVLRLLAGEISYEDSLASIELETRRYAKRQRTWIRSEPEISMLQSWETETAVREVLSCLR